MLDRPGDPRHLPNIGGFAFDQNPNWLTGYRCKTGISIGMRPRGLLISFFRRLPLQWSAVTALNCAASALFLLSSGKAGLDEILAQGLWFWSEERPFHSSGAGRE
jgi:hypothetical protein